MYRIGAPFWKVASRLGVPLSLRVSVWHDEAAGVYVATSSDLRGLVVEAASLDALVPEVSDCIGMLLEEYLHQIPKRPPRADLHIGLFAQAA